MHVVSDIVKLKQLRNSTLSTWCEQGYEEEGEELQIPQQIISVCGRSKKNGIGSYIYNCLKRDLEHKNWSGTRSISEEYGKQENGT